MKMITRLFRSGGGLLGSAAGFLGANRAWLTLLIVASAAAFLYARFAIVTRERDRLAQWIEISCASAGSSFAPPPGARPGTRAGVECHASIAGLARFRAETDRVTALSLADAAAARDRKLMADTAATRRAAEATADAAKAMEKANDLKDDRVSRNWFDAFNGAAGLQPPAP